MKQPALAIVVLCLMVVGCKNVIDTSDTRASKLVTLADAERILGGTAKLASERSGESDSFRGARESRCEYIGADRATLNVVIQTSPSEERARAAYDESRSGFGSFEKIEEVTGIGDEGYLSRGPTARRLIVRKRAVVILIEARRDQGGGPSIDEMKKTAAHIAGRL